MGFPRQQYWSGLPFSSSGGLSYPGIEPASPALAGGFSTTEPLRLLLSHFSRVRLGETPETAAHRAAHPWDSPGKNTGVGCHLLLQCVKVKSLSRDPRDCSPPGSSIHGIFPGDPSKSKSCAFGSKAVTLPLHCLSKGVFRKPRNCLP